MRPLLLRRPASVQPKAPYTSVEVSNRFQGLLLERPRHDAGPKQQGLTAPLPLLRCQDQSGPWARVGTDISRKCEPPGEQHSVRPLSSPTRGARLTRPPICGRTSPRRHCTARQGPDVATLRITSQLLGYGTARCPPTAFAKVLGRCRR